MDHIDHGNIYDFIVWIASLIREGSIVLKLGFPSDWRWLASETSDDVSDVATGYHSDLYNLSHC